MIRQTLISENIDRRRADARPETAADRLAVMIVLDAEEARREQPSITHVAVASGECDCLIDVDGPAVAYTAAPGRARLAGVEMRLAEPGDKWDEERWFVVLAPDAARLLMRLRALGWDYAVASSPLGTAWERWREITAEDLLEATT